MDSQSPDALCPPLEQTRSAVEARLGTLELEGTWRATYVLVHRERGDVVALKLYDPSGRVRLERELVAKDGTCATLAQVIALMLERYFLRPEANVDAQVTEAATSADSSSVPLRPQEKAASVSGPNSKPAQLVAVASNSGQAPPGRADSGVGYTLDAGLWVSSAWVAPAIGFGLRLNPHWELGAVAAYDLGEHANGIAGGWGLTHRIPLAVQVRQRLSLGALRVNWGAEVLGLYEHVHTVGLLENGSGGRVVPGVGLRAGVEFLPRRVTPFAELTGAALVPGLSRPFEVDHRSVFELQTIVIGLSFGIRTAL